MAQSDARRLSVTPRRAERRKPVPQPITTPLPTLWKAMILTSFLINAVLIAILILLVSFGLRWRNEIMGTTMVAQGFARENVVELRDVVQKLQEAHIITTIPLEQQLPLMGKGVIVPVDQVTTVTLQEPVPLNLAGADIDLGAGNRLRANNISLVLPQGTPLKISLKMDIPLDNVTIPIKLDVPVDIAMSETELAPQFRRLGDVINRLVNPAAPLLGIQDEVDKPMPTAAPEP